MPIQEAEGGKRGRQWTCANDLLTTCWADGYSQLTEQKRSVIDLSADQKPSGLGAGGQLDERDGWQKLADKVAAVGGSWGFIITFVVALASWVNLNVLRPTRLRHPTPSSSST